MTIDVTGMSALDRVTTGGHRDLVEFRKMIVEGEHPPGIERMVSLAGSYLEQSRMHWRRYLEERYPKDAPKTYAKRYTAAEHVYMVAVSFLAARLAEEYPKYGRDLPISEADALVKRRAKLFCSGWMLNGELTHHPDHPCEVESHRPAK